MNNIYKILIKNSSKKIVDDFDFRMWKNNNSKSNIISKCPYCESKEIIKYGNYRSIQRYKCKEESCGRTFTNNIYNKFRYSKKFKDKWKEYFELLNKGLTIRECAAELNITIVTAFFWRHRFLYDIKSKHYIEKITSYVELTKMVVVENFKGSREIPNSKRDKITIVNALNDSIDIIPIIAARKHLGFYEIRDNIIPRLDRRAYVEGITDGRLKIFAKTFNEINKVQLKKVKEKTIDIQYSIKAKKWLSKFRGVATKYLDHYLSLRLFEYKNEFEIKNNLFLSEKIKLELCLKPEINTYISWKNIKSKILSV